MRRAVALLVAAAVAACGSQSNSSASLPEPGTETTTVAQAPALRNAADYGPGDTAPSPDDFFLMHDGPLIINGPPWDCRAAGVDCGAIPEGNLGGTLRVIESCALVESGDGGGLTLVLFKFGTRWDPETSEVVMVDGQRAGDGDPIDFTANQTGSIDPAFKAVDEVRRCLELTQSDSVGLNTRFFDSRLPYPPTTPNASSTPEPDTRLREAADYGPDDTVPSPDDFFLVQDGPLVINGPPWDCRAAARNCVFNESAAGGTLELTADCAFVVGGDSGRRFVPIFPFGTRFDPATGMVVMRGNERFGHGDFIIASQAVAPIDNVAQILGLPDLPDELIACVDQTEDRNVGWMSNWYDSGLPYPPTTPAGPNPGAVDPLPTPAPITHAP